MSIKTNIVSAVIFILIASYFYYYKTYHIEELYFTHVRSSIFEEIKSTNDIDKLRSMSLMLIKTDDVNVKSYNEMLSNAFDVFIALSIFSVFFSIVSIIPNKKKSNDTKNI
jgi:uncharacterized membrane protein (DUF373 family)